MPSKNGDVLKHSRGTGRRPGDTTPRGAARARGRPRRVTQDAALEAAMRVFWADGYDGASMDRLSREMAMPRATIYQSFHNKEGLFLDAVAHFGRTRMADPRAALQAPSLRAALGGFYDAVITMALAEETAPGCLIASSLSAAAGCNPRLRAQLAHEFDALEADLTRRIAAARDELAAPQTPPETLALMVVSVARGLMLRARAGCDRETMMAACHATIDAICIEQSGAVTAQGA